MNGDTIWYKDFNILINNVLDFWPSKYHSYNAKVNAISRLIIYIGISVSLYRQSMDFMYIALMMLVAVYIIWRRGRYHNDNVINTYKQLAENRENVNIINNNPIGSGMIKQTCQESTDENPYANVLIGDNVYRKPACHDLNPDISYPGNDIYNSNNRGHMFHTTPNTTIPNDQHGYANWLYGNQLVDKAIYNEHKDLTYFKPLR